ncbi:MAG: ABC transporter ATP-binding protein/permease [Erysipelotrichaceae bacterium]|jgi:ATP-binding cassette subfamily B protein|nr:ABC transporter ATP-binding protein/permease [Erysipelotrichaceae bacterium]MCI1326827.1 ABC transporter ATP-binding protein/permease [Solobacterium sp.]MCH4043458.1 ABC transporter ATP-binding protein/permease [Erysipelotrichaceae bacterium]MCH4120681.1 ABC transporter ATP-binding protein/permease [Erysipelotrichaceae bacterium]MCI1384828.1 ABC transporter ATP-binding protein/permease [Solobacterium sp.]
MSERKNRPMMHGHHGPMGPGEKAKNFKGTMGRLLKYLRPFWMMMLLCILFSIISTVFTIIGPKILGNATTKLAEGIMAKYAGKGSIDFSAIFIILRNLTIIYLVSLLFSYLQGWIMAGISQKVTYNLRQEISRKINRLPLKYFDHQTHGEVLSRMTNDVDTVSQSLTQSLQQILSSLVTVIGILIMMFTISVPMTIMALAVVPLSGIAAALTVRKSQKYFTAQQNMLGEVNGHIEEMYGGHLVMKAFNGEEESIEKFDRLNTGLYQSSWKAQFVSGILQPVTSFIGNLGYVGVCVLGGWLAIHNGMAIGDIQAFIQYVRSFNQPITQTAQMMNILQSTAAAAERVFEFLDEKEEEPDTADPVSIRDDQGRLQIRGDVDFDHVSFGYDPDKIIIHDFNAHIKAGSQIAIVGPTGAGKTTIVKLLMRFYDLNSGDIRIDGIDTTRMTRQDLRSCFGMVLQDAWLHSGTIMENIRYGKMDASDDEVIKAADEAYVDHFIRTLEDGYQTVIDESSTNISQGQKQLLTIARAFLSNPRILILDEATSSVDTRTEILIQKGMENLMKGRTSFVIAHRLSTIRNADMILCMDHGDIVETGTHEELLAKNGFYAKLYNSQFQDIN